MHSLGAAQLLSEGAAQRLTSDAKSNVMLEIKATKLFIRKRSQDGGIGDQDQILKCIWY